jgi:hypothetical protein
MPCRLRLTKARLVQQDVLLITVDRTCNELEPNDNQSSRAKSSRWLDVCKMLLGSGGVLYPSTASSSSLKIKFECNSGVLNFDNLPNADVQGKPGVSLNTILKVNQFSDIKGRSSPLWWCLNQ